MRTAVGERPRGAALSQSFLSRAADLVFLLSCYYRFSQATGSLFLDVAYFALLLLYALHFWLLFVLLSSFFTLCLSSRLSLSGFYFFWLLLSCSVLFILWCSQPALFWVALSCFCIFLWCFANQKVLVKRLYKAMMHCVRNNTVCMLFPFEKYHR